MRGLGPFLKDAWRLSRPYFVSEEKWSAWGLLVSIIALNLSLVGMSVLLSFWNREFYNSLQDKNWRAFIGLLFWYQHTDSGLMPGFVWIAAVYIVVAVYRTYLNQWLQIRWRRWLTRPFHERVAGRPGLLPDQPDHRSRRGRHRQPRPAHRRGSARLRGQHALARHRVAVQRGVAVQLRRHPVGAVRRLSDLRHRHPRLHGLGGGDLRRDRHHADAFRRPPAGRD